MDKAKIIAEIGALYDKMQSLCTPETVQGALNMLIADAILNGGPNGRAHAAIGEDVSWDIDVHRTEGRTAAESLEAVTAQRDQLATENKHLRALIAKLVVEVDYYKPYARPPTNDRLECIYCESEWELGSQERHADECPIQKGRAAIAAAEEGT